jgi:hypothetical protein
LVVVTQAQVCMYVLVCLLFLLLEIRWTSEGKKRKTEK